MIPSLRRGTLSNVAVLERPVCTSADLLLETLGVGSIYGEFIQQMHRGDTKNNYGLQNYVSKLDICTCIGALIIMIASTDCQPVILLTSKETRHVFLLQHRPFL